MVARGLVNTANVRWGMFASLAYSSACGPLPPVRNVAIASFEMDVTEVTVGQYRECVHAGECVEPHAKGASCYDLDAKSSSCNSDWCTWTSHAGAEDYPLNCVTYEQAERYCEWAGKRLPTPEQWEYAAQRADNPPPWKSCATRSRICSVDHNEGDVSAFGIRNMKKGVREYTTGWASDYLSDAQPNWRGSAYRVVKGGEPNVIHPFAETDFISADVGDKPSFSFEVGFRCVRD